MKDTYKHKGRRKRLIDELILKGIKDELVIRSMMNVPRHLFLDKSFEDSAYDDKALPIEDGQTISQPYTVAFQTQLLQLKSGMKVLEIGTGSGYQAAVLAEMGVRLHSVERKRSLYLRAQETLNYLGYHALLHYGDGSLGWPLHAPYDRILVTAAAPEIPNSYLEQLKPGGMLVIPCGNKDQQRMLRITKGTDGTLTTEDHGPFRFVPLIGEDGF